MLRHLNAQMLHLSAAQLLLVAAPNYLLSSPVMNTDTVFLIVLTFSSTRNLDDVLFKGK